MFSFVYAMNPFNNINNIAGSRYLPIGLLVNNLKGVSQNILSDADSFAAQIIKNSIDIF